MAEEQGLLGKISGGIQGLLGNPFVRGVAGAAAIGVNPLLGLLAGPGIKSSRERRQLENDVLRGELTARNRQQSSLDKLPGLLGQQTQVQLPGRDMALLSPEGPDQSINIPGKRGSVPTVDTAEGQQQLMGLLGDIAPEAMTQGLLGQMFPQQERAEPSFIRELRAAGIDPASAEGRELVLNRARGQGVDESLLKALQLQMQSFQLDELRRKREEEEETEAKQRRQLGIEIDNTFDKGRELAALNDRLEETALATGQPFSEFSRNLVAGGAQLLSSMGVDTSDAQQAVADFDRFNKLATDFGIGLMERLEGTGAITNQKFQALQQTMAGIGTSPGANRLIIADILKTALDSADIENVAVEDRRQVESLIETLRGAESSQPDPVVDVPEKTRVTIREIQRLTRENLPSAEEIQGWTAAQRKALEKRLDQLGL